MCIRRICRRRICSDHKKIFSSFEALMACTGRKDGYVTGLDSQRPTLRSPELHLAAAARDPEDFVDA